MGFRSNFITEDSGIEVPPWFLEKYPDHHTWFNPKSGTGKHFFPISQLWESKFYYRLDETEIFKDIQRVISEHKPLHLGHVPSIVLILLHECGGITRVHIDPNSITGREPTEWKEVEKVEHDYCYGCSDAQTPLST